LDTDEHTTLEGRVDDEGEGHSEPQAETDYQDSESDLDIEEQNDQELHGVSLGMIEVVPLNENNVNLLNLQLVR
jgi:hypothetical protein